MPTDEEIVAAAAVAAEALILERFDRTELKDLDISVQFVDGELRVDVYLDPRSAAGSMAERTVQDAIAAAEQAVDELFQVE